MSYDPLLDSSYGSFSEQNIRSGFIKKVYSIVSLQLLLTTAIVAMVIFIQPLKLFFYSNIWLLYVLLLGTFIVLIVFACCEGVARSFPLNMILLAIFTVMEAFLVGAISSTYDTDSIFLAVVITAIIVIGLTLFAFQTKVFEKI